MQRNTRHGTRDMCCVYILLMAVDSFVFSPLKTTEVQKYTLWSVINRVRVCFLFLHETERERENFMFATQAKKVNGIIKIVVSHRIPISIQIQIHRDTDTLLQRAVSTTEWIRFICSLFKQIRSRRRRKQCTWSEFQTKHIFFTFWTMNICSFSVFLWFDQFSFVILLSRTFALLCSSNVERMLENVNPLSRWAV